MPIPFLAAALPFLGKAAASAGSSAIAGGLSKLFGGGQSGSSGFTLVQPEDDAGIKAGRQFGINQLAGLDRGGYPPWFEALIPMLRRGLDRGTKQTYFGQEGRRGEGLFAQAASLGSLTGVGPRATMAGVNKQFQDYANQSQRIDEYIAQTGVDINRETALNTPRTLASLRSQSPFAQPFVNQGSPGVDFGSEDFLQAASGGLSSIFSSAGSGFSKLFNQAPTLSNQVAKFGGGASVYPTPDLSNSGYPVAQPISQFRRV